MTFRKRALDLIVGGLLGFSLLVLLTPVSFWYRTEPEVVLDTPVGESPLMLVENEIQRDFQGEWSVTIRKVAEGSSEFVCTTGPQIHNYEADSTLPEDLDLQWWTAGRCRDSDNQFTDTSKLPEGYYRITTCHSVLLPLGLTKQECRRSNVFHITNGN